MAALSKCLKGKIVGVKGSNSAIQNLMSKKKKLQRRPRRRVLTDWQQEQRNCWQKKHREIKKKKTLPRKIMKKLFWEILQN